MKKIIAVLALIVLSINPLFAGSTGTSIFSFLKINPSARDSALGCTSSLSSDCYSTANPATITSVKYPELSVGHMLYLMDSNETAASFVYPKNDKLVLAGHIGYLGVGDLTKTVADSSTLGFSERGTFDFNDIVIGFGYGYILGENFSYGLQLNCISETIDTTGYTGFGASGGLRFTHPDEKWRLGFGFFNFGPDVEGYALPSGGYLGIDKQFYDYLYGVCEVAAFSDSNKEVRGGLEFIIENTMYIRIGYRHPFTNQRLGTFPEVNLTGGLGIVMQEISFDYAWVPYGDLGYTHRVSLTKRWGSVEKDEVVELGSSRLYNDVVVKGTIAVVDFVCKDVQDSVGRLVASAMRSEFTKRGCYDVIDRGDMENALKEYNLELSGIKTQSHATEAGKLLHADYVVRGEVSRSGQEYRLTVVLIDVKNSYVLDAVEGKAELISELREAAQAIARRFSSLR